MRDAITARLRQANGRAGFYLVTLPNLVSAVAGDVVEVVAELDRMHSEGLAIVTRSSRAVDAGSVICASLRNDSAARVFSAENSTSGSFPRASNFRSM